MKKVIVNMEKLNRLKRFIKSYDKVVVACSGGVDSTFLLKVCCDTLGPLNVLAVTVITPVTIRNELVGFKEIISRIGVKHIVFKYNILKDKRFVTNSVNRCYYCKKRMFKIIKKIATERKFSCVFDGSNLDDFSAARAGINALRELGIVSPLAVAGLNKDEVRNFSFHFKLPICNKPANSCLATRIPYGYKITKEALKRIKAIEEILYNSGFRDVRLREYWDVRLGRIEVNSEDLNKLLKVDIRKKIIERMKLRGYKYITVDLEGFRSGSMDL